MSTTFEVQIRDSQMYIDALDRRGAAEAIASRCEEPWIVECVRRDGADCITGVGAYALIGPDDETLWPAAVVRVDRPRRNAAVGARSTHVAIYVGPEGVVQAIECTPLDEQRTGDLPKMPASIRPS